MHFFTKLRKKKEERGVQREMYSVIAACVYFVAAMSLLLALLALGWYTAWHLVLKRHRITQAILREFCTSPEEDAAKRARQQLRAHRRKHRRQFNQILSACTAPPSNGAMAGSVVVGTGGRTNISGAAAGGAMSCASSLSMASSSRLDASGGFS
jgi:hypothetical protein